MRRAVPGVAGSRKPRCPRPLPPGYGPRFTALLGELSGSQRSSRSAVQEFCRSVLGVPISQGAIQRAVDRVSEALKPYYEAIAVQARRAPVNYIDETGWYQHGVLAWLWVMVNTTVALFKVQASRSQAAFEALSAALGRDFGQRWLCGVPTMGPWAPDLSGASDPAGTGAGGAERARAGPVWGPGAGGIAAVGPLGPGAPDRRGGADLVCAAWCIC